MQKASVRVTDEVLYVFGSVAGLFI
jgi:hypothetical protein